MSATAPARPRAAPAGNEGRLQEERRLLERFADHPTATRLDELVERFLPLARSLAARYSNGREGFDDVFQVACVGS